MLTIDITELEFYDSAKEMFIYTKPLTVRMEHSLMSIAKWESIWEKPYLPTPHVVDGMTGKEEEESYIRCMLIGKYTEHIPSIIHQNYGKLLVEYIQKKHSATTINRRARPGPRSRAVITAEVVYYWMLQFSIPFECERWHFNRLLMLIDVCSVKESEKSKGGKMTHRDSMAYMQKLNKERQGG